MSETDEDERDKSKIGTPLEQIEEEDDETYRNSEGTLFSKRPSTTEQKPAPAEIEEGEKVMFSV